MVSDSTSTPPPEVKPAQPPRPLRVWPAVVLVALFWTAYFVIGAIDVAMFVGFLLRMAVLALVTLAFIVWWLTNRGISRTERFAFLGAAVLVGTVTISLTHSTVIAPACSSWPSHGRSRPGPSGC